MPARRFFVMLKAARKIRSWEFSQLCDVASIPLGDGKYFDAVKSGFNLAPKKLPEPTRNDEPVIKSESQDAMWAMMALVNIKKGRH